MLSPLHRGICRVSTTELQYSKKQAMRSNFLLTRGRSALLPANLLDYREKHPPVREENCRRIRIKRCSTDTACEFETLFLQCANLVFEELGASEYKGLPLHHSDLDAGSCERPGGYSADVEVEDWVTIPCERLIEEIQCVTSGRPAATENDLRSVRHIWRAPSVSRHTARAMQRWGWFLVSTPAPVRPVRLVRPVPLLGIAGILPSMRTGAVQ